MAKGRVFTDEELKALGALTLDLVLQAIDEGNLPRSKKLARRMYREFMSMHDLYRDWVTALLSFVGKRFGDEALEDAFRESCAVWIKPLWEAQTKKGLKRRIQMLVYGIKGHGQSLEVREDEEKFTIILNPCGSGGRLARAGAYDSPRNFLRIKNPQSMTYGRLDFPVYCAHCAWQEILPIEWSGVPWFVMVPADKIGYNPNYAYVYKDPRGIPEEFYQRLGKDKWKSLRKFGYEKKEGPLGSTAG